MSAYLFNKKENIQKEFRLFFRTIYGMNHKSKQLNPLDLNLMQTPQMKG
jgi:hypothetical protein